MKLESEIKQKKFKDEYHKLAVNIIYTHGWLNSHQTEILNKYGLTPQQYNILRILRGRYPEPATVNMLKERMLDKMSDVSRLVERLRIKKLIERKNCENDCRRVDIIISAKGLYLLDELGILDDYIKKLLSNLNKEEAETANELLDKMRG